MCEKNWRRGEQKRWRDKEVRKGKVGLRAVSIEEKRGCEE
jgi:hypothetical protein